MPFNFDPENPTQQPPYRSNTDGILYEILKATKECATGGGGGGGVTISSRGFIADANGLPVIDRLATSAGNVDIIQDAANSRYKRSGVGAVTRLVNKKLEENVSVEDYGAVGDGIVDDTTAIQAAFNYINTLNGGTVYFTKNKYKITDVITIYTHSNAIGNNCRIIQYDNTKSVFQFSQSAFNQHINIKDFIINYHQRNTEATLIPAINLGRANVVNYKINITGITIEDANVGIGLLSNTGSFCFYLNLKTIEIKNPTNYAIICLGDPAAGSGTNYSINDVWAFGLQDYSNTSYGFLFVGVSGFYGNNLSTEYLKSTPYNFVSCQGLIGNIYTESCVIGHYGGPEIANGVINLSNTNMVIQNINCRLTIFNSTGGDTCIVKCDSGFHLCSNLIELITKIQCVINITASFKNYILHLNTQTDGLGEQGQRIENKFIYEDVPTDTPFYDNTPIDSNFGIIYFNGKQLRGKNKIGILSTGDTITLHANTLAKGIVITGTTGNTVNIGTTAAGTDILNAAVLDANGKFISNNILYYTTDQVIHISGNTNPVTIILPI